MNNMYDYDFEKTQSFYKNAREFEFTKKAAGNFTKIVNLGSFEDKDAEVIFDYLYKEMTLVYFGDYLKRYVYERSGIREDYSSVDKNTYKEIIINSFKETNTPKSMTPTSTKMSSLVNNWLTQASVKRETIFLLGFGLSMPVEDVSDFLTKALRERDFDMQNPEEVIYKYSYINNLDFAQAEELKREYEQITPVSHPIGSDAEKTEEIFYDKRRFFTYLSWLKAGYQDPKSETSEAFRQFLFLYEKTREIIAEMYQQDEEEKKGTRVWTANQITPSDIEKVICNGIPINTMGNLKKMSASTLNKHFSQKRFSRQRITNILNHKFPVERFDLITLGFFVISQKFEDEDPYIRYQEFLKRIRIALSASGMGDIYVVNPYECFVLMCLLTDSPMAVFSEIWEKSYEETE